MIVYIMGNSDSVENHKQKKYYHKMFNWIPSFPTKEYDFINSENQLLKKEYDKNKNYVDLRNNCPAVIDVGDIPIHPVSTICTILNYNLAKNKLTVFPPSLLFIFKNSFFYKDVLSPITFDSIFKSIEQFGFCSETDYNLCIHNLNNSIIPESLFKKAEPYKFIELYRLTNSVDLIKHCLQNQVLVAIGIVLYTDLNKISSSLWLPDINKDKRIGGLSGVIVGYINSQESFIVQLGFGDYFADAGYITIPYTYVEDPDLVPEIYCMDFNKNKIEGFLTEHKTIISLNKKNDFFI